MEKIDFHIHTIQSLSDSQFEFDISIFNEYIESAKLSCIAITNHNLFDLAQFKEISSAVKIKIFPGIEIDLENGHILVISDNKELEDFDLKCKEISKKIKKKDDYININDFLEIFPDLGKYILIPHYDKKPELDETVLSQLKDQITSGEVSSPKKFITCINDDSSLVPLYFSDIRIDKGNSSFPTRQTYIDIGETSFSAIKYALRDKNKVFLSREDGHKFFEISNNGLKLSSGLNVILGERSSGKTYTLNNIYKNFENIKYIRQFELLERDDTEDAKRFKEVIGQKQSMFTQDYLRELKLVVDDLVGINIENNEKELERYLSSLIKNAREYERADSYSKAKLFNETAFSENDLGSLKKIISAVNLLIENDEYRKIIDGFISNTDLMRLAIALMNEYEKQKEINLKKRWINDLVSSIQKTLQVHTAATRIKDIDLYKLLIDSQKIKVYERIVKLIKKEKTIVQTDFQGFKIVAKTKNFINATEMKNLSGKKIAFSDAFLAYQEPYDFLKELRKIEGLEESEYYRFFVNIDYQVLNKHGFPVSGGERSEFRLLQEISDAQQFNMLLIDEPESSFDNLFLKNEVNKMIRGIAKSLPVVIVTHNNTVGASIIPDFVLYTKRLVNKDGSVKYEIYSGHPSDKELISPDDKRQKNFDVLLNCLEAGKEAYKERGTSYEILKD